MPEGLYVMTLKSQNPVRDMKIDSMELIKGEIVSEVKIKGSLIKGKTGIEFSIVFENAAESISFEVKSRISALYEEDNIGKSVVFEVKDSRQNQNNQYFTDSNGLFEMKREFGKLFLRRNHVEELKDYNFQPVTSFMY